MKSKSSFIIIISIFISLIIVGSVFTIFSNLFSDNDSDDEIELLLPEFVSVKSESEIVNNTLIATITANVRDCLHSEQSIEGEMVTCGPELDYFASSPTMGMTTGDHMRWLDGDNYTVTVEIRGGFSVFIYYLTAYHKDVLLKYPKTSEDIVNFFNTTEPYYIGSENISINKTDELVDDVEIKYNQPEKDDLTIQFELSKYQHLKPIDLRYDLFNGMRGGISFNLDEERYQRIIEEGADDLVYGVYVWIIVYPNDNTVLIQEYTEYR